LRLRLRLSRLGRFVSAVQRRPQLSSPGIVAGYKSRSRNQFKSQVIQADQGTGIANANALVGRRWLSQFRQGIHPFLISHFSFWLVS